ncbi:hypothetical protein RJ641_013592 [Dillenia turbinata]|uniref:Uncharacterized protein n=1 Tax=Dillenia turbinata TaxID=194707 RepID=A0AAN8WGF2_9MAGN
MGAEGEKQEVHVLVVAFSSQGHINPMLRLGKRLTSKGLRVTLATTEIARTRILSHLAEKSTTTDTTIAADAAPTTTTIYSVSGIRLAFYSDGLSLDYDRKNNLDYYMETLQKCGPINLSNIMQTLPKFSCIITNPFVPWAADVAANHNIPCALLWIQPCTIYAIYYRFYNSLNSFPIKENPEMSVELPGLPLLHTQDLPSFVLPSNPFGSFPKMFSNMFQSLNKFKWILGNSFYELEKAVIDSVDELHPIKPVGPLVPPSLLGQDPSFDIGIEMWKSEGTCMEWLNQQNPDSVIYISFGSITVLSSKQMENIAMGIKSSKFGMDGEGVVNSEEIESCIKEMTSGPRGEEIKKKALKLKQAARDAVAEGGTSDRNIQAFVDEFIAVSCN